MNLTNTPPTHPTCDRCGKPVARWSDLLCDECKGVVKRIEKDSPTLDEFAKRAGEKEPPLRVNPKRR